MLLRFWGVRGSVPVPGASTTRVGGNTTCVSIESDGYMVVFDAGTGIRRLGQFLEQEPSRALDGCIFLSHYHWDHIQGLPFFQPAFRPDNRFHLFGEQKRGADLYTLLREQMQTPYFPVTMVAQQGLVTFNAIEAGEKYVLQDRIAIETTRLNHPAGAVGFRVTTDAGCICIVTDHEHSFEGIDSFVVDFAQGADILVHEAPYNHADKQTIRRGWGHSSWQEAAEVACAAKVGRLFLSHHDPDRTDDDLDSVLDKARQIFARTELATETTIASLPE